MPDEPSADRLRFKLGHLMLLVAAVAIALGLVAKFWPDARKVAAIATLVGVVSMAIMTLACLVPGRHGRWIRPLAAVTIGIGALALGVWLQRYW